MRSMLVLTMLAVLFPATPAWGYHDSPATDEIAEARAALAEVRALTARVQNSMVRRSLLHQLDEAQNRLEDAQRALGPSANTLPFSEAVEMVREASFDRDKLEVIEHLAQEVHFTSWEARALASELAFERTRRQALLALYPAVTDPEHFDTTLDILAFSASREAIEREIGQ